MTPRVCAEKFNVVWVMLKGTCCFHCKKTGRIDDEDGPKIVVEKINGEPKTP